METTKRISKRSLNDYKSLPHKKAKNNNKPRKIITKVIPVNQLVRNLLSKVPEYEYADKIVKPEQPINYRGHNAQDTVSSLIAFNKMMRARYLYAMIHPDRAVMDGIQVKMYSDVPLPTSSVGMRTTLNLTTSSNGKFLLCWRPNYFDTQYDINYYPTHTAPIFQPASYFVSNLTYNNAATLSGTTLDVNNVYQSTYLPNVNLTKYRLVSAIIKVRYNGSVLQQAGTMYSCASFARHNCVSAAQVGAPQTFTTLMDKTEQTSKFGDFGLIRNGIWNHTENITEDAAGIECLYVPLDPTDCCFQATGVYYGGDPAFTSTLNSGVGVYVKTCPPQLQGAHINYVIAGENLPANTQCIQVEIFSNFEVIADPSVAPFIRSAIDGALDNNDNRRLKEAFSSMAQQGQLVRKAKETDNHFDWNAFIDKAFNFGKGILPIIANVLA